MGTTSSSQTLPVRHYHDENELRDEMEWDEYYKGLSDFNQRYINTFLRRKDVQGERTRLMDQVHDHTQVSETPVNEKIVKYLLRNGADVNATDERGRTALMYAMEDGRVVVVTALLAKEPLLDVVSLNISTDWPSTTALIEAIKWGHMNIVKMLLAAGAKPNVITKNHMTALKATVKYRNCHNMVPILLKGGADPNILTDDNMTVLTYAIQRNSLEIFQLLLQNSTNIEEATIDHCKNYIKTLNDDSKYSIYLNKIENYKSNGGGGRAARPRGAGRAGRRVSRRRSGCNKTTKRRHRRAGGPQRSS